MPGGNGMGPAGAGSMTGRAAGFCAGNGVPGRVRQTGGYGCGWGHSYGCGGFGRGFRNRFFATGVPGWARFGGSSNGVAAERQALACQAKALRVQLDGIQQRLDLLEKNTEAEG